MSQLIYVGYLIYNYAIFGTNFEYALNSLIKLHPFGGIKYLVKCWTLDWCSVHKLGIKTLFLQHYIYLSGISILYSKIKTIKYFQCWCYNQELYRIRENKKIKVKKVDSPCVQVCRLMGSRVERTYTNQMAFIYTHFLCCNISIVDTRRVSQISDINTERYTVSIQLESNQQGWRCCKKYNEIYSCSYET